VLNDDNEASMHQTKEDCTGNTIAAEHERGYKFLRKNYATFAEVKESQNPDNSIADKSKLPKNKIDNNEVAESTSLCLATTCPKTDDVTSSQESGTNKIRTDDRTISAEILCAKVCEGNRLSTGQQKDLYKVLAKYQQHLTKRPGKCTRFEYELGYVLRWQYQE
jgi:hypothetical protein